MSSRTKRAASANPSDVATRMTRSRSRQAASVEPTFPNTTVPASIPTAQPTKVPSNSKKRTRTPSVDASSTTTGRKKKRACTPSTTQGGPPSEPEPLTNTSSPKKATHPVPLPPKPSTSSGTQPQGPTSFDPVNYTTSTVVPGLVMPRAGFASFHTYRDDAIGAQHATHLLQQGLIDEDMHRIASKPLAQRTVEEQRGWWSKEVTDEHNAALGLVRVEDMMSEKAAEASLRCKEAKCEKWIKDWEAGKIDDEGNVIVQGGEEEDENEEEDADEDDEEIEVVAVKELEKKKPAGAKKKDALHKVVSSKVVKKAPASRKAPAVKKTPLATIIEESPAKPAPKAKPASKPSKPAAAAAASKPDAKPAAKAKPASLAPLPGLPTYEEYKYMELAALCNQRNIMSGGDTAEVRNRLIQDDINVVQNLPRDAKNYSKETQRKRATVPPVVPNAPTAPPAPPAPPASSKGKKRSRGDDDDDDDDDDDGMSVQDTVKAKKARKA